MATTMPLTFSPPRLHHSQGKLQQPRPTPRLALFPRRGAAAARLRCAPGGEATAPTAEQEGEDEEFVLLASNRSDFNEVIMVIDSPSNRYLVLDPSRTYGASPRTWIVLVSELTLVISCR
jgi:hypothetical protein